MSIAWIDRWISHAARRRFGVYEIVWLGNEDSRCSTFHKDSRTTIIWAVSFVLRDVALAGWLNERRLVLADLCCGCGARPEVLLGSPCYDADMGWLRRIIEGPRSLVDVPHCPNCAKSGGRLLTEVARLGRTVETTEVHMMASSAEFLRETVKLNRLGDVSPPWVTFPGIRPMSSAWRQGNSEYWYKMVWLPFFVQLSSVQQERFIAKWKPPDDWKVVLIEQSLRNQARGGPG